MANAFSILHNYDQPLYTPDFNLIGKVMSYKQNKLDMNRAKLQNLYDQYSMLDVARGVDQDYVNKRLERVRDIANRYSNGDLSSDYLTKSIAENIDQVVDDNVINAVASTKIYRSEQAEWSRLKEDSPEKYSDLNYAYAQQAAVPWLTSDRAGEKYKGGAGVIEYVDINKIVSENAPKIAKQLEGAEWVETSPGNGYFRDIITKQAVDRGRMKQALDGLMGQKELKQMSINAWGNYGQLSDEQLEQQYNTYYQPKLNSLQSKVSKYNNFLKRGDISQQERQSARSALEMYNRELENFKSSSNFNSVKNAVGREGVYTTLYNNQFFDNYLDAYSYAPRATDVKVHQGDVAMQRQLLSREKFEFQKSKWAQEYELKVAKAQSEGTIPGGTSPTFVEQTAVIETRDELDEAMLRDTQATQQREQKALEVAGLNSSQGPALAKALSSTSMTDILSTDSLEIEVDGSFRALDLTVPENREAIINYKKKVLEGTDAQKVIKRSVKDLANTIQTESNILDYVSGNSAIDLNYWYTKNPDGSYTSNPGGMEVPFVELLRRKKNGTITEEEQFNLDVITYTHLSNDKNLSDGLKEEINYLLDYDYMTQVSAGTPSMSERFLQELPEGIRPEMSDQERFEYQKRPQVVQRRAAKRSRTGTTGSFSSLFGRGEATELVDPEYFSEKSNLDNIIKDFNEGLIRQVEQIQNPEDMLPSVASIVVDKKDSQYDDLYNGFNALQSGQLKVKHGAPITIERITDDQGRVTDKFEIDVQGDQYIDGKKVSTSRFSQEVTETQLRRWGINYQDPTRTTTIFGPNEPLDLGPAKIPSFSNKQTAGEMKILLTAASEKIQSIKNKPLQRELAATMNQFNNGDLSFKLEYNNDKGLSEINMYDSRGRKLYSEEYGATALTSSDIANYLTPESLYAEKTKVFYNYLDNQVSSKELSDIVYDLNNIVNQNQ